MGTRMPPNYAIIFMHYLEINFLSNYPKQPKIWLRFIDDIFMIWNEGRLELEKFLEALNSYHPTVKFMHTIDENEIPFWTQWYIDHPPIEATLESSTNQQTKNIIYTTTQPTQETPKRLCPLWPSDQSRIFTENTTLNKRSKNIQPPF